MPSSSNGSLCWVVEHPGEDIVWFDSDGRIRKRLLYWGPGEPRSVETVLSDYTELAPGLKLPKTISVAQYANPRLNSKDWWDRQTLDLTITLRKAEFNQVVDADFELDPPIGTVVNDYVRRVRYTVPQPGEEPFEEAIKSAALDMPVSRIGFIALNAVIVLILIAILVARRFQKASQGMHRSET